MKHFLFSTFLVVFSCIFMGSPSFAAPSIAILELDAKGGVSKDEASIITDRLRAQLIKTGMFQVLERSRMESLLKEQGFQQSVFCDDTKCKAQIGKLLGVEGLIIGVVSRLDTVYTLSIRVLDVNRGIILKEEFYDCECPLKDVLTQVTPYLVARLTNQNNQGTSRPTEISKGNSALPLSGVQVSTLAGNGSRNHKDGEASIASFDFPMSLLLDTQYNIIIADTYNHRIRKLSTSGYITTLAGSTHELMGARFADGESKQVIFNRPYAMARHPNGLIYITDTNNHRIRIMNTSGEVSTFVGTGVAGYNDGNPAVAMFNRPQGIAIDKHGNLYVADTDNHSIRKVSPEGRVTTVAGNGQSGFSNGKSNQSQLQFPTSLIFSEQGDLIIADTFNHSLRKLSSTGELTTLAGNGQEGFKDGPQAQAEFRQPRGLALGKNGVLYIADTGNHRIRELTPQGSVATIAGTGKAEFSDGNAAVASFDEPIGLIMDNEGNLYVADSKNHRIRKISFR